MYVLFVCILLLVSQYINKGCSTSWHFMMEHLDKFTDERLQRLDLSNANPENVAELIKEEYSRDGIEYMSALTLVFLNCV